MRVLFIFLDGVGLGDDNPASNPFAVAHLQNLDGLLNGARLLAFSAPFHGSRASLVALDASLGVEGLPQSATGQAVLLTGTNIPARTGEHYGHKPNPQVASYRRAQNLFTDFRKDGRSAALLNAYPPRYFQAVNSGRRLYSA